VVRLVTFVDVDDDDDVADACSMSVSTRHEAVLANGRHVLLLDDPGWSASGPPNIWAATSIQDIVDTTRMVVGPDEPFGERSHEDMKADHWARLSEVLRQQGGLDPGSWTRVVGYAAAGSVAAVCRIS
jgi:hypothetical protein